MKALVYQGPKKLQVMDMPKPVPQAGELLVKVKSCGICGSDVHGYLGLTGRRTAPMIMGHEFAGEVVELGKDVRRGFKVKDRIIVQPCISCLKCKKCGEGYNNVCETRDFMGAMDCNGAMAEYICIPEHLAFHLPEGMSYNEGALLEAFAVSYAAVKKAGDLTDKNVMIIGGGTIGQLALLAAKSKNPRKVVVSDLSDFRLEIAKASDADEVINSKGKSFVEETRKVFGGELADVAIEAVGIAPTVASALDSLAPQGTCVWIGNNAKKIEIDMQKVVTRELNIRGSYIYTQEDFGEALAFFDANKVDISRMVSGEISLDEAPEMFEKLVTETEKYLKCIIKF